MNLFNRVHLVSSVLLFYKMTPDRMLRLFAVFFSPGTAVMSDFIDSEAEESEEEFEEKDLKPKKNQRFMEEDGEF